MPAQIEIPNETITAFCRRHQIRKLALFGSVLRDDFGPDSDIDVLVEFEPGADQGLTLLDLAGMEIELSCLLGRRVDFVLRDELKPFLRDNILSSAEVIYG